MAVAQIRLFTAVPADAAVRSALAKLSADLQSRLAFRKWTHPEDFHITLQFLGDTGTATAERIEAALDGIARRTAGFALRIRRLGTFGASAAPKVLYAGVDGDLSALARLQAAIVEATEPLGFAREKRPYRPHLTLARKYTGERPPAAEMPAALSSGMEPLEWPVREIALYRSHLGRSPMYEPIARFPLSANCRDRIQCEPV